MPYKGNMTLSGDVPATAEDSYRMGQSPTGELPNHDLAPEQHRARGPLADVLSIARRHWKLAISVWLLVFSGAVAHAMFVVPVYTATGAVQVSAKDGLGAGNPLLELAGGGGRMELQTEVEIMRRKEFVLGTLRRLRLQVSDPHQASRYSTDLEITLGGESPVDPLLTQVREAVKVAEIPGFRRQYVRFELERVDEERLILRFVGKGPMVDPMVYELRVGQLFEHAHVHLEFERMPFAVGVSKELELLGDGALHTKHRGNLTVTALGTVREPTSMVELSMRDSDRVMAARFVQLHMERYLEVSLAWQAERASRSAEFIRVQLTDIGEELASKEDELREFAERQGAVDLETQARVTIENGALVKAERAAVEIEERSVDEVNRRLRGRMRRQKAGNLTANFMNDPLLAEAIKNLTMHELELELLQTTHSDEHPQVQVARKQLERERKEISRLMTTAQANLEQRKKFLDERVEQLSDNLAELPEKQLEFGRLKRSVEVRQGIYGFMLEKLQESEIMEAATTTDKRIVDSAKPPHEHSKPRRTQIVAMGMVAGLVAGLAVAYLYSSMNHRLATVEAVREEVGYPVYATIPKIDAPDETRADRRLTVDWIWSNPHAPAPEAFRALRVNVGFVPARAGRGRVLQVTSSEPAEGKSTVLANLAVSLVKSGARVLIIDLDLRRPVQHRVWQISRSPGYSEYAAMAGDVDETTFIQTIPEHEVDVLPAGKKVPETLSSIMSPALPRLLRKLAEQYDYVLVDSPPVFVSDALVVAPFVDLLMVTARPGHLQRSSLSQTVGLLSRVQGTPKGLILNGVTREHSDYYYGSRYYYAGSAYYGQSEDGDEPDAGVAKARQGLARSGTTRPGSDQAA